jgi:hypothetical protein
MPMYLAWNRTVPHADDGPLTGVAPRAGDTNRDQIEMSACNSPVGLLFLEGLRDDLRARVEGQLAAQAPRSRPLIHWGRLASITTLLVSVWSGLVLALFSLRGPL